MITVPKTKWQKAKKNNDGAKKKLSRPSTEATEKKFPVFFSITFYDYIYVCILTNITNQWRFIKLINI